MLLLLLRCSSANVLLMGGSLFDIFCLISSSSSDDWSLFWFIFPNKSNGFGGAFSLISGRFIWSLIYCGITGTFGASDCLFSISSALPWFCSASSQDDCGNGWVCGSSFVGWCSMDFSYCFWDIVLDLF